jgi:hypothetical protein
MMPVDWSRSLLLITPFRRAVMDEYLPKQIFIHRRRGRYRDRSGMRENRIYIDKYDTDPDSAPMFGLLPRCARQAKATTSSRGRLLRIQ